MKRIIKIDDTIENQRKYFDFLQKRKTNWKMRYTSKLLEKGIIVPSQNKDSDFEYFIKLKQMIKATEEFPSEEYLYCIDDEIVTQLYVMRINKHTLNVSFITVPEKQNRGYATEALSMLEELLFKSLTNGFIQLTDMSPNRQTTKIAKKLGYIQCDDITFIKPNPILVGMIGPNKNHTK